MDRSDFEIVIDIAPVPAEPRTQVEILTPKGDPAGPVTLCGRAVLVCYNGKPLLRVVDGHKVNARGLNRAQMLKDVARRAGEAARTAATVAREFADAAGIPADDDAEPDDDDGPPFVLARSLESFGGALPSFEHAPCGNRYNGSAVLFCTSPAGHDGPHLGAYGNGMPAAWHNEDGPAVQRAVFDVVAPNDEDTTLVIPHGLGPAHSVERVTPDAVVLRREPGVPVVTAVETLYENGPDLAAVRGVGGCASWIMHDGARAYCGKPEGHVSEHDHPLHGPWPQLAEQQRTDALAAAIGDAPARPCLATEPPDNVPCENAALDGFNVCAKHRLPDDVQNTACRVHGCPKPRAPIYPDGPYGGPLAPACEEHLSELRATAEADAPVPGETFRVPGSPDVPGGGHAGENVGVFDAGSLADPGPAYADGRLSPGTDTARVGEPPAPAPSV